MPDSLTAPVHRMLASGMSVDAVIGELKRQGFDQPYSAQALHRSMTISLEEATQRVAAHRAWKALQIDSEKPMI